MQKDSNIPEPTWLKKQLSTLKFSQLSLLVLAGVYTLYFIRPVLLPIILALLLSLILKPIHRFLCNLKIPSSLASVLIVLSTLASASAGIYFLLAPTLDYADKLRDDVVKQRISNIFYPIAKAQKEITSVATNVNKITQPTATPTDLKKQATPTTPHSKKTEPAKSSTANKDQPLSASSRAVKELKVPVQQAVEVTLASNPIDELFASLKSIGYHLVITFTLVYFLLAYGEKMISRITEVDVTADVMKKITNQVSHYMFTITIINIGLGIVIGLAMWAIGLPNPILWGTLAATLNFIPYLGAIIGAIIVFSVSATTFDQTLHIALAPTIYYLITAVEGNFITPAILGESFKINPIIVFLWILCWGALWGIPGMLIGLPILMTTRIILNSKGKFSRLERIISS